MEDSLVLSTFISNCAERMKSESLQIYIACLAYTPVNLSQFYFVPPKYQIYYLSVVNVVWNLFISMTLS